MNKSVEFLNLHPLNKSKTKEAHSFSKSPRITFPNVQQSFQSFYSTHRSTLATRPKSASFAFGRSSRYSTNDFLKRNKDQSPSPNSYYSPGFAQLSINKNKGLVFTTEIKNKQQKSKSPGPSYYQSFKTMQQKTIGFAMNKQKKNQEYSHWNKVGPSNYSNSKKDAKNVIFSNAKRFQYQNPSTPSPGDYSCQNRNVGKSPINSTFGRSKRNSCLSPQKDTSPGPAYYNNSFSEFSQRSHITKNIYNLLSRI